MYRRIIEIVDAQITDPNDELYDLQKKYNVKISRGGKWGSIYIFRNKNYRVRVGHPMTKENKRKHIPCFAYVYTTNKPTKEIIEKTIKKYF